MLVNRRRRDESGSALITVLIVVLVLGLITVTLSSAIANTTRTGVGVRTNLQAQAAADAGLAAASLALKSATDVCTTTVPSGSVPASGSTTASYAATIVCNTAKTQATVTASGTANGSTSRVQVVYAVNPSAPAVNYTAGGPGLIYTYQLADSNTYSYNSANSEVLSSEYDGAGALYAVSGDVSCWTNVAYPANLYLGSGSLNMGNGCTIRGNAYIGGTVNMQSGGVVEGALVAPSTANHTIAGTVGTTSASTGRIDTGGTITLNRGTVRGSVNAAGTGNSTLGEGLITGDFTYKGTYNVYNAGTEGTIVKGSLRKSTTLTAPTLPAIPNWQDVVFTPSTPSTAPPAWAAKGYQLVTVPAANCNQWATYQENVGILTKALTSNTIYDIRACGDGLSTNSGGAKDIPLNRDVAIIANKWYLSGAKITSNDGQPHTLYLITPDSQPSTPGPQCNYPAGNSEQGNGSTVDPKIAVYIYTPCEMNFNDASATFRGQVYAGKVRYAGGAKFSYAPRAIPGYDFGAGVPGGGGGGAGTTTYTLGALISRRDVG
jgi:Tfp pilus assembly protein PilX